MWRFLQSAQAILIYDANLVTHYHAACDSCSSVFHLPCRPCLLLAFVFFFPPVIFPFLLHKVLWAFPSLCTLRFFFLHLPLLADCHLLTPPPTHTHSLELSICAFHLPFPFPRNVFLPGSPVKTRISYTHFPPELAWHLLISPSLNHWPSLQLCTINIQRAPAVRTSTARVCVRVSAVGSLMPGELTWHLSPPSSIVNETTLEVVVSQETNITGADTTQWQLWGLEEGSLYRFHLRACTRAGCGPPLAQESRTPPTAACECFFLQETRW